MVHSDDAERDLDRMLRGLSPELREGEFVFCTLPGCRYGDHAGLEPLAAFAEREGLTLVLPLEQARRAGLTEGPAMRCITLGVHSSLEAVGLTAAVADALARSAISANVIAAWYHDHVFVPAERAGDALAVLEALSG